MRRFIIITVGVALLAMPAAALAGVAGSEHDLSGSADKLCFNCHVPHNALGDKLWARTPSATFTGVQALCHSCHDGTVTSEGSTTVFDDTKEQHKTVGPDCSGDGACHDVHNQNPNGGGRFLVVTETNGSYCESCHDATPFTGAEALGDHTAGITHFTNGGTFTCNQCHTPHGATAQTNNPVGLTNPILLDDNNTGTYGDFCISCHNGTAPSPAVSGSGGQAATDVFNYERSSLASRQWQHPTTTTAGATPVNGCDKCHDVHDPAGTAFGYLLKADNANSAYCLACHTVAGAPPVGANSHYVGPPANTGMNTLTAGPTLPWADQIDEDGTAGADWPTATANDMVCETCHSVHKNGYQTVPAYALRDNNANNEICQRCHTAN